MDHSKEAPTSHNLTALYCFSARVLRSGFLPVASLPAGQVYVRQPVAVGVVAGDPANYVALEYS